MKSKKPKLKRPRRTKRTNVKRTFSFDLHEFNGTVDVPLDAE